MNEKAEDILVEVSKQIAKEAYSDAAKPIMKPTGQIAGLVPRAIKAALLPVEKWILGREYNLEETKKLLELKLQKTNPELIESPEPYIAVPALQYISYCMDSEELRDMYANLLANSMNKVVKDEVHPGFTEIIKQLSPDEAKILKILSIEKSIPIIKVRYENEKQEGYDILRKFSTIADEANCEKTADVEKYIDNLERLGIINTTTDNYLTDETIYNKIEEHSSIAKLKDIPRNMINRGFDKFKVKKGICKLTMFGQAFCKICID